MHRIVKYIGYLLLFAASFVIFLYWVFPYDSLKERLLSGIERQLGNVEVSAGELVPYWFTGVEVKDLKLGMRDAKGEVFTAFAADRFRARVAVLSLIIGSPRVSYYIRTGKGEIAGVARQTTEVITIDADLDDFDISSIRILANRFGLKLSGKIDGYIEMELDKRTFARSNGRVELALKDLTLAAGEAKLGPMDLPLPALTFAGARGSAIKVEIGKGALMLDALKLADGDLGLDITGKIFLSSTLTNSRFNLKGAFKVSEVLNQALPFLFIVEKEKQPDGSYPLTVTGRLSSPVIKVGNFTLPF